MTVTEELAQIRRDLLRVARRITRETPAAAAAVEDALRYDLAVLKALKKAGGR